MVVTFGEILGRIHFKNDKLLLNGTRPELYFGGSEANVTAALSLWQTPSAHVTVLPDSLQGKAIVAHLQQFGLDTKYVLRKKGRLGIYYSFAGKGLRAPEVIYDRDYSAFAMLDSNWFSWTEILQNTTWFHWSGITPAISAQAAHTLAKALYQCQKSNITVSADINYRRTLWNYGKKPTEIMPELMAMSNIIIGAATDLANCTGITISENADAEEMDYEISKFFGSKKTISYSIRTHENASHQHIRGILRINGQTHLSRTYQLYPIQDRIGSGDAFVAGLIYAMLNEYQHDKAIEVATAAAALKHFIKGDILTSPWEEIESISQQQSFGKLLR